MSWLMNNMGTIVVLAILAAIVTGIIRVLIRDRKCGRSSCGAGCAHCAMGGSCHKH
ncbi:MAG: FeoB-associated Cys-rich membrane protein [Lachnospiraceae bacterium]|nr:FeoB-associated Cys-rich membrane protein [Lachnospiraceae bacterium]